MVYGICRTMLRDANDAEDATQQVFLSAHRALLEGARVRDSGAWLATIARNECRGRITAVMRLPLPLADEDLEAIASSVDDVERRLQVEELRSALAELPERQREAVVLRTSMGSATARSRRRSASRAPQRRRFSSGHDVRCGSASAQWWEPCSSSHWR
jgi:RNA polymerase sigma factor (sigma-70 family)